MYFLIFQFWDTPSALVGRGSYGVSINEIKHFFCLTYSKNKNFEDRLSRNSTFSP